MGYPHLGNVDGAKSIFSCWRLDPPISPLLIFEEGWRLLGGLHQAPMESFYSTHVGTVPLNG
jgi:hypothetical protein